MPPKRLELPPEPWQVVVCGTTGMALEDANENRLIWPHSLAVSTEQEIAMFRIFAAAPAALRVCEDVVRFDDEMNDSEEAYLAHVTAARAALAIAYPEPSKEEKPLEKEVAEALNYAWRGWPERCPDNVVKILVKCRQRGWLEE